MSWLYSRALVEEFSAAICSAGARSALSSGSPTPRAFLPPDRMTAFSRPSRFGMTFAPLTDDLGAELLTWFLADSRAKHSAAHHAGELSLMTSGRKCGEWWQMSLPGACLPRTFLKEQLKQRPTTSKRWATKSAACDYQRRTWVQTTFGQGIGYLHTPTVTANFCAPSMQKHPSCRLWVQVFGRITPAAFLWLMGWPQMWTNLKPLAMDRCHSAPPKLSDSSHPLLSEAAT